MADVLKKLMTDKFGWPLKELSRTSAARKAWKRYYKKSAKQKLKKGGWDTSNV